MPSTALDFTFSNTAPSAISVAAFAGTGSSPAAVAGAAFTPSNTAPSAITPPSVAGTGSAPVAVALASFAPDNTAPAAVALAAFAGTGAEPAALAVPLAATVTPQVPQLVGFTPDLSSETDLTMHTPSLSFAGELTVAQPFGLYKPITVIAVKGVQLSAQVAPVGAAAIIELIDSTGASLGRTATLPDGSTFADVTFVTPLALNAGTLVRAKLTQVGSTTPGSFLTATLIAQTVP